MQITDVEQRLTFLDTEHRRERADLDKLRAKTVHQAAELKNLSELFQQLVDDLGATQARLSSLDTLETSLTHLRGELVTQIEAQGKQTKGELTRLKGEDTSVRQRTEALEKQVQAISDLATNALRQTRDLQTVDNQHNDRLTHLAEQIEGLHGPLAVAEADLEKLKPRIDTHTAEAANLYRLVQALEERMTTAQAITGELRERLKRQDDALTEVARAMQALRVDLTATQGQLVKFPHIEEALTNAKTELTLLVRDYRAQHQIDFDRSVQERRTERQVTDRAIADLNRQLEVLPPIHQRLSGHDRETARLSTLLGQLDARLDSVARDLVQGVDPIPFLNEQLLKHDGRLGFLEADVVKVDHKLNAKVAPIPFLDESIVGLAKRLDFVEAELPTHVTRLDAHQARIKYVDEMDTRHATRLDHIEAQLPGFGRADAELLEKVEFLEDWVQRTATRLDEVQRFEDELRRTLTEVVEAEKVRSAHRDQRMLAWEAVLAGYETGITDWQKTLRGYADHHQGVTRQMQEMRDLGTSLDQQQRASIEAQRIEAEKIRREVGEWRQDVDKRWALFFKQRDWDWKEQRGINQAHADRLTQHEQWRETDVQSAVDLAARLDSKDRELLMRIEDLWEIEETAVQRRIADTKAWLAEIQETKAQSPKPRVPKPGEKSSAPTHATANPNPGCVIRVS